MQAEVLNLVNLVCSDHFPLNTGLLGLMEAEDPLHPT